MKGCDCSRLEAEFPLKKQRQQTQGRVVCFKCLIAKPNPLRRNTWSLYRPLCAVLTAKSCQTCNISPFFIIHNDTLCRDASAWLSLLNCSCAGCNPLHYWTEHKYAPEETRNLKMLISGPEDINYVKTRIWRPNFVWVSLCCCHWSFLQAAFSSDCNFLIGNMQCATYSSLWVSFCGFVLFL
jgi:hypothetical protein